MARAADALLHDPDHLGDFLTGLFALARELVQRQAELVQAIDGVLMGFSIDEFLQALPALRLAFTYFTPREKHYFATTLMESLGQADAQPLLPMTVAPEVAAQALAWEHRLFETARRYGIRVGQDSDPVKEAPVADAGPSTDTTGSESCPTGEQHSNVATGGSPVAPSRAGDPRERKLRWRLVLGSSADQAFGGGLDGEWGQRDRLLAFLYDREYASGRNVRRDQRTGDLGESALTVPEWINQVHELFPKKTIERIEKDGLERYQIQEMVNNPQVLERAQPNVTLLKAILHTKHLMNQEVLAMAKHLVRRVVQELMEKLAREVQAIFSGARNRRQRSFLKVAKNFDLPTTIRRNLAQYQPDERRIYLKTPYFYSRIRRQVDRWQIIIVVDESGSMMDSVLHAAVTASIFWGLSSLRTHLILFDTSVVDVTQDCSDPVETMMKIQLGGGTDIGQAVAYDAGPGDNPRQTISS